MKAIIFDWAGTVVDYGCRAPVAVLEEIFAAAGVPLVGAEARHAMGWLKRDQIRAILGLPRVCEAWRSVHGEAPSERDVERLFASFLPRQIEVVERYSDVIEGVARVVEQLRGEGWKIGSTTGYTRAMLAPVIAKAAQQGYCPDASVTPDEVSAGRPAPWMIFRNLELLDVFPAQAIKVGDTPSDIEEGRNAGLRTIAIVGSSNEAAAHGVEEARRRLAGADLMVDRIEELPEAVRRLSSTSLAS